jgi:hypothetical protein
MVAPKVVISVQKVCSRSNHVMMFGVTSTFV